MRRARDCTGEISHFGRRGHSYIAPAGTIQTANDGGWCWITIGFNPAGGNSLYVPPLRVTSPPKSGDLRVGSVDQRVRFAYRPNPGFAGTDSFSVNATTPNDSYDIPVTVTVTP